jgi:hypothetical protein
MTIFTLNSCVFKPAEVIKIKPDFRADLFLPRSETSAEGILWRLSSEHYRRKKTWSFRTDYYTTQYTQATPWLQACLFAVVSPNFLFHIFSKLELLLIHVRFKNNIFLRPPWRHTRERRGTAALIVRLSAGWRRMLAIASRPLYPRGKKPSISTEWGDFCFCPV